MFLISWFAFFTNKKIKLLFLKISEHCKWSLVYIFYSSPKNFRKNTFNFLASLWIYLVDSVPCNNFYFVSCIINYAGSNLCCLINGISLGICDINDLKSSYLPSCFLACSFSSPFLPLFCRVHGEILSFLAQQQRNQ